jgi:hypothetical protein
MKRFVPGALAGLAAAALLAAPAFAGPTVTVRVEGQSATLLERTQVTLPATPPPVAGCQAGSAAAALEEATQGNWDRQVLVQTILGETHAFADSDYWALWNGRSGGYQFSMLGACDQIMAAGDEALFLVDRSPPPDFAPTAFPLALRGLPAAVQVGAPVSVSVVSFGLDGTATPVEGATVGGGGASAVTGADGAAALTFAQPGTFVVKASKAGSVVSAGEGVTVSVTPPPPPAPGAGGGAPAAADTTAPTATIAALRSGRVFSRKRAPRELRGTVSADPSGIKSVRLSILRRNRGRCWAFDGESERFKRHRCGGSRSFRIGDSAEWSYLLPKRLPRGRYTIRVAAVDKAGNDSATETRIRVR